MYLEQQPQYEHMIVGAGLVGALLALYLKQHSGSIVLFESN